MPKTTDNIVRIVSAGGSVILSAADRATDNLVHIASVAAREGSTVTIRDAGDKFTDDLVRIVSAGKGDGAVKGTVTFVL